MRICDQYWTRTLDKCEFLDSALNISSSDYHHSPIRFDLNAYKTDIILFVQYTRQQTSHSTLERIQIFSFEIARRISEYIHSNESSIDTEAVHDIYSDASPVESVCLSFSFVLSSSSSSSSSCS